MLARILPGDPLGLRDQVARALAERAYLLDADRVYLRSLARCARHAGRYRGRPELSLWLTSVVEDALEDLLREEREERGPCGVPPAGAEPRAVRADAYTQLARPLGLDPERLRLACARYNRLEESRRRTFYELVIRGRTLDELARATGAPAVELAREARAALEVFLTIDEDDRETPAEVEDLP